MNVQNFRNIGFSRFSRLKKNPRGFPGPVLRFTSFFFQFINNFFALLLRKINVFDIFHTFNFFRFTKY